MKNKLIGLALLALMSLSQSCRTSKQLTYFKDLSDTTSLQTIPTSKSLPLQLQPDDQVQISISSPSAEATSFFNLMNANPAAQSGLNIQQLPQSYINVYTVSSEGKVTLPVLGDIVAYGLTLEQFRLKIVEVLKPYLTNAIVSARLTNFKVTVIGEVGRPSTIPVNGEKINVLEAIGASGDMTMFGARQKVKVFRKLSSGATEVANLDFNKSKTFQSPYFDLRQNDVVYVQPNRNKSFLANNTTFWASLVLSAASIITIIVTRR